MKIRTTAFSHILCLSWLLLPAVLFSETIGIFYAPSLESVKFAAGEIKSALEAKSFTVEMSPISSLVPAYNNKKIIVTLASDNNASKMLQTQGGAVLPILGEQAYAIQTTKAPQLSYWIFGGDKNGAMYGGFQIAENIRFNGFSEAYNLEESPKILKRGIKLNLPFDVNSTTYFNANNSTSSKHAIAHVWDMTFWTTWFDEMARHRYNVVSVWNNHPFTSMIKMADYPDVVINDVKGYPDYYNDKDKKGAVIKKMTIEEKIDFWKKVMAYGKSRGFSFYLFNWNLFLYGAEDKYGLTRDIKNEKTIQYLRKCTYELFKTYPDLDGFGVTQGEAMGDYTEPEKSAFLGATFGKGMADFAKENPQRKLNFIHRWWMADFKSIQKNFGELLNCPNVTFDMSIKYSMAHMYSMAIPDFIKSSDKKFLEENKLHSWFTVRNDDFYYHNWGNPDYAREYLKNIPGQGKWFKGFYIGSDGFIPTRTFFSKNSITQGILEVQRQWYMNMIWGRLSYNPNLPDDFFKNHLKCRFPTVSSDNLFIAWGKASSGISKVGELFFKDFKIDKNWYPENCQSDEGFIKIGDLAQYSPLKASTLCSIKDSASNNCNGKTSSLTLADQMESDAKSALTLVSAMEAPANSDLGVTLTSIRSLSYLSLYYAHKIRGATYSLMTDKKEDAKNTMGAAYSWWLKYSTLMDENFRGMSCQRNAAFETWHQHDEAVLKEYTDLGGAGVPNGVVCN